MFTGSSFFLLPSQFPADSSRVYPVEVPQSWPAICTTPGMTSHEPTMNMAVTSAMLGTLLVRSISLAAVVSLVILLLAALLSSPI